MSGDGYSPNGGTWDGYSPGGRGDGKPVAPEFRRLFPDTAADGPGHESRPKTSQVYDPPARPSRKRPRPRRAK
jgi:hypothetical protein